MADLVHKVTGVKVTVADAKVARMGAEWRLVEPPKKPKKD